MADNGEVVKQTAPAPTLERQRLYGARPAHRRLPWVGEEAWKWWELDEKMCNCELGGGAVLASSGADGHCRLYSARFTNERRGERNVVTQGMSNHVLDRLAQR
jgi:hypothetical protein